MGTNRFGLSGAAPAPSLAPQAQGTGHAEVGRYNGPMGGGLGSSNPRANAGSYQTMGQVSSVRGGPGDQYGTTQDVASHNGGVAQGGPTPQFNAVQNYQNQGPDLAAIQAQMQRQNVGAQLNANPQNSALAGYMMS